MLQAGEVTSVQLRADAGTRRAVLPEKAARFATYLALAFVMQCLAAVVAFAALLVASG